MLNKNFEPKDIEQKQYELWEKTGVFKCNPDSKKPAYVIPMPPPNVTGNLHMGHALDMTLQDVASRFKRLKGFDVLWQPGTDHAGIATQMIVDRNLLAKGEPGRVALGREKFLEKVWEWKEQSGGAITNQVRKLGCTPDWSRERFTMDEGLNRAVRKVFVQLYKEKLIYKDVRLVNWDPKMHTALSDLEVAQIEKKGHMWHIKYPIENSDEFITVATTRPETMLGDTGVAVNPEDARYKHLIGKNVVLPIVNRVIPIVADEHANPEKGTGAVKITPAHDFNDFEVGKRHNLDIISVLDKDAKLNENAPEEYRGMDRFDARKVIVAKLEELGLLDKIEENVHAVPHDEKSKSVILEPFLTSQWYCDAPFLAKAAIKAVEDGKTKIIPEVNRKIYFNWMENIQPWCISRQIWWGHQVPAWYGPEDSVFVEETEEEAYAEARKKFGNDVKLVRDDDVLDTWFSSALWPFSTLGWPDKDNLTANYYPASALFTAKDIIFFWVARMMMMGCHFMKDVPFDMVYFHALVRDEKGQKMSKTKGNGIDPLEAVDKYGADALRMTLASLETQGKDIRLSLGKVESSKFFTTKIWNAARFCEMNGCKLNKDFNPENVTQVINKWIITELAETAKKADEAMNAYRFNDLSSTLYHFTWGTFCDWYIELIKPILQGEDSKAKTEVQETACYVLDKTLQMLNILIPFITEELHSNLLGNETMSSNPEDWLIKGSWPEFSDKAQDKSAQDELNWVVKLISEIRSVRSDMNVPASAKIIMQLKDANAQNEKRLATYNDIICRLARLEKAEISNAAATKGSIQTVIDEATIILPIADVIDIDAEKDRLKKAIDKEVQNIEKLSKMLSNPGFVAKAPEEVVEEQKESVANSEVTKAKLEAALKQLQGA